MNDGCVTWRSRLTSHSFAVEGRPEHSNIYGFASPPMRNGLIIAVFEDIYLKAVDAINVICSLHFTARVISPLERLAMPDEAIIKLISLADVFFATGHASD